MSRIERDWPHGDPAASSRVLHSATATSRRDFLTRAGAGFGGVALSWLAAREGWAAESTPPASLNPLAARPAHFESPAKRVIFIFIDGGPSHIDLFDPKPALDKLAGEPLPDSFERVITPMGVTESPLLASKRKFKQHGECGAWVSDWLPHTAKHVDEMTILRSCWGNGLNHVNGLAQMNTGSILGGRPCLGSWVTYGLGTENENLPAFVVMLDGPNPPPGGPRNWGTGFMPATFQGTQLKSGKTPIDHLQNPSTVGTDQQRAKIDFLAELNRLHLEGRDESELEARIRTYELAFQMQAAAPEAIDLAQETAETQSLYGLDDKATEAMGRSCLLARRMVERGVRFVQVYSGAGSKWDAHSNIEGNHSGLCKASDKPVAALLTDLKRRGLLDSTLVIWGGEFGRTPMSEKGNGRDHNPYGFTMWLAGGGVVGGQTIGTTDEVGLHAIDDRMHIHDLHATMLYLLGLDHWDLTFTHAGRKERATMNEGSIFKKVARS